MLPVTRVFRQEIGVLVLERSTKTQAHAELEMSGISNTGNVSNRIAAM